MRHIIILYSLILFAACGRTKTKLYKATQSSIEDSTEAKLSSMDYSPTFDKAHPNAKRLLNDEFFFDVLSKTAPFGSDDGADCYAGFKDWRQTHKNESPVVFLKEQIDYWGYPKFDITETDIKKLTPFLQEHELGERFMRGTDAAIVAIAFGQLYLEGTIDNDIKELAKTSIKRQQLPEILKSWQEHSQQRSAKLNKLLSVLNAVK